MHLGGACVGAGARVLSEITRVVSGNKWRVSVGTRCVSRNGACVGDWGGMGELGQMRRVWLALQKLTCVGDRVLGRLSGANHGEAAC